MKIAFIGTSHISSLKLGWEKLPKTLQSEFDVAFIGFSAPLLAKQIYTGWDLNEKKLKPTDPQVNYFLEKISGQPNTAIEPLEYDVICFVDLFFCYDFSLNYAQYNKVLTSKDNIPISSDIYKKILEGRLGKANYTNHPTVGNIPNISTLPLIAQIRNINKDLALYLTPRPFLPSQNLTKYHNSWPSTESINKAGKIFDAASENILSSFQVSYLPRTKEQISKSTGVTPDKYSLGLLDDKATLNEHMNGSYGLQTINQLLVELKTI